MTTRGRYPVTEAWANLKSMRLLLVLEISLAVVAGCAVVGITAMDASALINNWSQQEAAGRSSFIVTGKTSEIPAVLCDSVNSIDGVRGAGGILSRYPVWTSRGAYKTIDMIRVTRGYPMAAWGEISPNQGWSAMAPVDLANRMGLGVGSTFVAATNRDLTVAQSVVTIDLVAAERSRVEGINDAIVVIGSPTGVVSKCLVAAEPAFRDSVESSLSAWFGSNFRVADFLPPSTLVADPDRAFAARPSQWIALAVPSALVVVCGMFFFARRSDFGLYRALGMTKVDTAKMALTELLFGQLLPFQAGAALGLFFAVGLQREGLAAVSVDYSRALCVLVLGALTTVFFIIEGPAFDRIRGR